MKKNFLLIAFLIIFNSCKKENNSQAENNKNDFSYLQTDFLNWWNYQNENIELSLIFKSFDEKNKEITNIEFLKKLESGNYIPINIKKGDIIDDYKLLPLTDQANNDIRKTIKQIASKQLNYLSKEGKLFPTFDLKDIENENFSNASFENNITIVKCWFINCKACVAEFPELNQLVENYNQNENINFLSMAFDSKEDLSKFIQKRPFKFKVLPVDKKFMENELNILEYPTHFVINKSGEIEKIFNNSKNLISYLNKRFPNTGLKQNTPAAPPSTLN